MVKKHLDECGKEEGIDMKPGFLVFETSQMVSSFNWGSGNQNGIS